jgi:hypothetical protein
LTTTSKAQYMKEWRAKKAKEDPEYLEQERAKARERSRARLEAKSNDPEFLEAERTRKRELAARRRADPEKAPRIKEQAKAQREKPQEREKHSKRCKEWRSENPKKVAAYQKQWRDKNADAIKEYSKEYSKEYGLRPYVQERKRYRGLQQYGLTPEGFNDLWTSQRGKCAICEIEMRPRGRDKNSACIDHNHLTGDVRGLLCRACNHGIGNLKDDPDVLEAAAKYLRKFGHYSSLHHTNLRT